MIGFRIPLIAALTLSAATAHSLAEDRPDALPGVEGEFSVVNPAPEPDTETVAEVSPYGEGFVRIPGTDTYLRISGLVRYDVEFVGKNRKSDQIGQ